MNILFLARSLNFGGAERQIIEAAIGLKQKGHKVNVAVFYGGGDLENELKCKDIRIIDLQKKNRWDFFPILWNLKKTIKLCQVEIIYSCLEGPNIFASILKLLDNRLRVVWWLVHAGLGKENQHWSSNIANHLAKIFSSSADLITANSFAGKHYASSFGYQTRNLVVIPNGIDTERFNIDNSKRVSSRQELNLSNEIKIIGIIGRIDPVKSHADFIAAAAIVLLKASDIRFIIVGDGDGALIRQLKNQAEQLKINEKIVWLTARKDIEAIYNTIDILCMSSLSEGLPNVLCEAMSCGKLCVVTDVGDAGKIVANDRYISPKSNPVVLAEKLINALEDLPSVNPISIRQRIIDNFSKEKFLERTESNLCLLTKNKSRTNE